MSENEKRETLEDCFAGLAMTADFMRDNEEHGTMNNNQKPLKDCFAALAMTLDFTKD